MNETKYSELPIAVEEFAGRLTDWYAREKRDLPWRRTTEPYPVWLSEVMLQQTQVKTVLPYFNQFLNRYPTIEDLARAEPEEVLDAWSGLGYYSRARNLQRAARIICREHGGRFPDCYETALQLPGVGPYSAGAVLSIAYGRPYAILDGNIRRVLARFLCIRERITARIDRALRQLLGAVVQHAAVAGRVAEFNQSLMELGALVCTPQQPSCPRCPLHESCRGKAERLESELPVKKKRSETVEMDFTVAVIDGGGRFLFHRNQEDTYLRDFWEFPRVSGLRSGEEAAEAFRREHALDLRIGRVIGSVEHRITYRKIIFQPVAAQLESGPPPGFLFLDLEAPGYPKSSYIQKITRLIERNENPA